VSGNLTPEESAELAFQLGQLAKAGMPLSAALRAVAADAPMRRLASVLRDVADRLAGGAALDEAIAAQRPRVPDHLRGLLTAGVRSGRLVPMLDEFVAVTCRGQDLRQRVALRLLYPAGLVALLGLLVALFITLAVPEFARIFRDFGTRLPAMTELIIKLPLPLVWIVAVVMCLPSAGLVAMYFAPPGARWSGIMSRVPLVGSLVRWGGLARFCQLMAMLLDAQVPAAEALRLAAGGVAHAGLAAAGRRAAVPAEAGEPLDEALAAQRPFPPSMIVLIEWGRLKASLTDAFRAAGEMFESRARDQGFLLEAVTPPLALMVFLSLIGVMVIAMFLPFIQLIQCLSGGG
jgi:general secretion pathway protein F